MAKTKSGKATSERDEMAGVKTGGITKSSHTPKSKSKDIARAAADKVGKAAKKTKEALKQDSDSDSESDSDSASNATSDSSESSGSDSETETKSAPKTNGAAKTNGNATNGKAAKAKESESESSDEDDASGSSSDGSDSEDEAPAVKTSNGKTQASAKKEVKDDDDEGSSSDSSSSSAGKKPSAELAKSKDDSSDGSSDSSDDSDASEDEEDTAPKKRKQSAEAEPATKRAKTENKPEAESENKGKNLFVGNLPWSVDEPGLGGLFEEFGEILSARLITDRDSGRSKGYGYVEFVNSDDAAKALEAMAGTDLEGRKLNVDFAVPRKENPYGNRQQDRARAYGDSISEPSATLFVGNISFDADEQMITDAFAEHATLKSVRLPTDVNSGALRGFGYVEFHSIEDATMAFNSMQGAQIAGRSLRLDYSAPRAGNDGSRGRGRGGFGDRGGRGRGGFGDRGGRGGRGGFGDRGGRGGRGGGRGGSTNRGGMGDFSGKKMTF